MGQLKEKEGGREGYNRLNDYFDLRSLVIGQELHPEAFSVVFNFDLGKDSNIDRLFTFVEERDRLRIDSKNRSGCMGGSVG